MGHIVIAGDPPNPPSALKHAEQNYAVFFGALRAAHPHLQLIANCQLGDLAPTQLWEYHVHVAWRGVAWSCVV